MPVALRYPVKPYDPMDNFYKMHLRQGRAHTAQQPAASAHPPRPRGRAAGGAAARWFFVQSSHTVYTPFSCGCAPFLPLGSPTPHAATRPRRGPRPRTNVRRERPRTVYRNRAHTHAALGCVGAAPDPPIPGGPTPCIAVSMLTRLDMHWSLGGPLAPTRASASASCWCSALTCLGLGFGFGLGLG